VVEQVSTKQEEGVVVDVDAKKNVEAEEAVQKVEQQEQQETTAATAAAAGTEVKVPAAEREVSANAFVTGANMNGGCVMTGRPTSRVLAPPGGHTSIKLG
jgi:hypothetical protein